MGMRGDKTPVLLRESDIRRILKEETKKLIKEGGIKDIKDIAKRYQMAKLYFHLD